MRRLWKQAVAMIVVLTGSCLDARAGTITWTNSNGTFVWNTAANWNPATVPGPGDTARFNRWTGLTNNNTVTLGANQTISTLDFSMSGTNITIGGDGYSLTLTNGSITASSTPGDYNAINAPIILGAPGNFGMTGGGYPYLHYKFLQPISDGGNNYGLTLTSSDQGAYYFFYGNNTYGSTTVIRCRSLTLSGANGAITNSDIRLSPRYYNANVMFPGIVLDNTAFVNNDRLGDNKSIIVDVDTAGTYVHGGSIYDYGTNVAAYEQAGTVQLNRGVLQVTSYVAPSSFTNVMLRFAGINRAPGTCLNLSLTGGHIAFAGATNANSIWQPWAFHMVDWPYYVDFVKVASTNNGDLAAFGTADYTAFPTSGADSTKVYIITTTNPVVLAAAESVYALAGDASSNVTLQLGNYDLRIASGALIGREHGGPLVTSTGGRLIFGGNEMILAGRHELHSTDGGDFGVGAFTLNCPILCDGAGAKRLVIGGLRGDSTSKLFTFSLTGQDLNGTYGSIFAPWAPNANSTSIIELGGSSDRTVTEYLGGDFALAKSGSGTLRLSGVDQRVLGGTTVSGGRLVFSNSLALASAPTVTNAILEIAAGITNSVGVTLQYGATLTGGGTLGTAVTVTNGVHVSPGNTVGKLTVAGTTTFYDGANIDWDLGNGTNTAGTDYDLLSITGNLALPASPATLTLHVRDAGNGAANPKGATFTVAQWTGSCLTNSTLWSIVNDSPKTLDTSGAVVTVNTNAAVRKIMLSGLRQSSRGSAVFFR